MSLVGKKVMVKVYDTNTRPEGFTESDSIENALELGFELGKDKNKFYLKKDGEYFREEKVIKNNAYGIITRKREQTTMRARVRGTTNTRGL